MSEPKYKPGDKFILEIDTVDDALGGVVYNAQDIRLSEWALSKLKRYDESEIARSVIQRRIDELMLMVASFENERDALCDYLNGTGGSGKT